MKVLFLQDMDPFTSLGGAQLNDRAHLLCGLRQGHDIQVILPDMPIPPLTGLDGVVVSNAATFPLDAFQKLAKAGVPYIFFLHDFWFLCKYRLYYAQQEKCRVCYLRDRWIPILNQSKLIIWLSPMHREAWLFSQPELEQHPYALVPSAIDPKQFYDLGRERKGTLAVGSGNRFKGSRLFLEWARAHPEEPITLLGGNHDALKLPPNVTVKDFVPYDEMNCMYNQFVRLLHLTETTQPFERTVPEAYLAGCRITANANIGCMSWPFMHQGRQAVARAVSEAPLRFWEAVEKGLKCTSV